MTATACVWCIVDQCDKITMMGASTTLKYLKKFCRQVKIFYSGWFLRASNATDFQNLLNKGHDWEHRLHALGVEELPNCLGWNLLRPKG